MKKRQYTKRSPKWGAESEVKSVEVPVRSEPPKPVEPPRPFPLQGPMDGWEFDACWNQLTPRGKARIRTIAANHHITVRMVLHRWPEWRVG